MVKIERFTVANRCLHWKEKKILVVGDLHLGYEDYLAEKGWSFPKTQLEETRIIFKKIFKETGKLKTIILLGDVKHYFAGILNEEFSDFKEIMELLQDNLLKNGKIIIIKGNHDNILEPVIRRWGLDVQLVENLLIEDILFFHGNKESFEKLEIYDKKIKTWVVGHFHPAITISEGVKKEKYKCFLVGKHRGKKIIILPSFFPLIEGSEVNSGQIEWLDVSNFKVYAVADKVYDFGVIRNYI